MDVMYQYIALGRYTQHVYVGVSGRYSRNCVDFLSGCTDKLPQAFTKQRVCIGTDQDQRSILFSLAEELHTALRVIRWCNVHTICAGLVDLNTLAKLKDAALYVYYKSI